MAEEEDVCAAVRTTALCARAGRQDYREGFSDKGQGEGCPMAMDPTTSPICGYVLDRNRGVRVERLPTVRLPTS